MEKSEKKDPDGRFTSDGFLAVNCHDFSTALLIPTTAILPFLSQQKNKISENHPNVKLKRVKTVMFVLALFAVR